MRLFAVVLLFILICTASSKSHAGNSDVVCLGHNYFIGLSQHPDFEMIKRQSITVPTSSYRVLQGKIQEYALLEEVPVMVGTILTGSVDKVFLLGNEEDGYFIIDFKTNNVVSGLTEKEMITSLEQKYSVRREEFVLKSFSINSETISPGSVGRFRCPVEETNLVPELEAREEKPPRACTMEAKQCPDGSYVSRIGPNCEFAKCPSEK